MTGDAPQCQFGTCFRLAIFVADGLHTLTNTMRTVYCCPDHIPWAIGEGGYITRLRQHAALALPPVYRYRHICQSEYCTHNGVFLVCTDGQGQTGFRDYCVCENHLADFILRDASIVWQGVLS